jgi:hypothetical protein
MEAANFTQVVTPLPNVVRNRRGTVVADFDYETKDNAQLLAVETQLQNVDANNRAASPPPCMAIRHVTRILGYI